MTLTFSLLVQADQALWHDAAAAWRRLYRRVDGDTDELIMQTAGVRSAWTGGTAAPAATAKLERLAASVADCRDPLLEADQVLSEHAERIRRLRARLAAIIATTRGTPVRVAVDGVVSVDYTGSKPDPGEVAFARRVAVQIEATVRSADEIDSQTARRLDQLAQVIATAAAPTGAVAIPAGGGPAAVARWWSGLTDAQRRWLISHRPQQLGRLDGVPAAVRDRANRQRLDELMARLRDRIATTPAGHGRTQATERLANLHSLQQRLEHAQPRAYLLGLDGTDDGRAIVAFGNPDVSDHIATYVPGVGASLDRLGGELDRAATLQGRATTVDGAASTSTIMWLGYDAPDFGGAALERAAGDARAGLTDFQAGLVATHQGELGQQTLVGHSYGSLVIGVAERDGAVVADDIIALGSPGMGVDRADQLRDPTQVWASTARNDVILLAPSPGETALGIGLGPASVVAGSFSDAVTRMNADLWHGVDPSSGQFGGQVFSSAVGTDPFDAHASYFDDGNPALQTMAEIVVGRR
jgi:hypothetical protein